MDVPGFENTDASATCLLAPHPEQEAAVGLLSQAADALIAGDVRLARLLVEQADMPELRKHAHQAMCGRHPEQRRRSPVAATAATAKRPRRGIRNKAKELLYARDGWRCRYCGCRVTSPDARKAMSDALPGAIRWGQKDGGAEVGGDHGAFYAASATPDHVVPRCVGGLDDDGNLVTACQACQYGRGRHALEEFGLSDPRERPPVVDDWDGLTRLLRKPETGGRQPRVTRRTGLSPAEWFAALDAIWPTASTRLTAFVESCADLDVRWTLNEVLLIKAVVRGETLSVVGVKSDGLCEIPWSIGTAKESCRTFAEKLTEGIPGTVAYETRKTWSVSKPGKKRLDVIELLDAAPALRLALEALRSEEHVAAD